MRRFDPAGPHPSFLARRAGLAKVAGGLGSWLLPIAGLALFLVQARHGLWFAGFGDETTHLLGGRVLNAGGTLYRDFVDNHGPVIYVLTWLYGSLAGWSNPNYARLIPVILTIVAGIALATSPALTEARARRCAFGLFFGLVAQLWITQGLYLVSFYPVAGAFATIALAWFPAVRAHIPDSCAAGAGIAAGLLTMTGYQFAPSAALLAMGTAGLAWKQGHIRPVILFTAGNLAAVAAVLVWLAVHGDVPGYLAFHIAFGQTAFRPFIPFTLRQFAASLNPSFAPAHLVQALASIGCLVAVILWVLPAWHRKTERRWVEVAAAASVLIGITLLNVRGEVGFKDGTFVLASAGYLTLGFAVAMTDRQPWFGRWMQVAAAGLIGLVALVCLHARVTPTEASRDTDHVLIARRLDSPLANRIRTIIGPGETFLALVYQPNLYWEADRLPMKGFFEYFPWDAAYAKHPWFNRPRDLCVALSEHPPRLIAFDDWAVWGYQPEKYMPCVIEALQTRYCTDPDFPRLHILRGQGECN